MPKVQTENLEKAKFEGNNRVQMLSHQPTASLNHKDKLSLGSSLLLFGI